MSAAVDYPATVPAQLAQIHEQIKNLATTVNDVKVSVGEVAALDRTLAELAVRHVQMDKEVALQWSKLSTCITEVAAVDSKVMHQIQTVNSKADEWINRARGAFWTALMLGSFAQTVVIGAIAWTFTHLRSAEEDLSLVKYRVTVLEKQAPPPVKAP